MRYLLLKIEAGSDPTHAHSSPVLGDVAWAPGSHVEKY